MAGILFHQTSLMFLLMFVGLVCYKKGILTNQGSKEMGSLLITIVLPCIVIRAFHTEYSADKLRNLGIMFLLSGIALVLSMWIARCIFGYKKKIEHFGTSFSNSGFMGIPLVQALFGEESVYYIVVFVALLGILQWTYGVMVMTESKKSIHIKTILKNPVVIGTFIGVIIYIARIPVPDIVMKGISYIADLNTPLAMIVLGGYLAQADVRTMFRDVPLYFASFIRLLCIPLATLLVLLLIPIGNPELKLITLVAASTPVGSNVAIFAQINDLDYTHAVRLVCLSTVFSIFTLPLIFMLVEKINL